MFQTFAETFQLMKQVYYRKSWGHKGQRILNPKNTIEILCKFIKNELKSFFVLHGNGIEYVQKFNLTHFDREIKTQEGLCMGCYAHIDWEP